MVVNSSIRSFLGDSNKTRVLEYLWETQDLEFTKKDIIESTNVNYKTLNSMFKILELNDIVKYIETKDRYDYFKLNKNNSIVKQMIQFFNQVCIYW